MFSEICINNKPCGLMKAFQTAKYGTRTVLTDSSWEYVSLFLKRQSVSGTGDALFYWKQAQSFYKASINLPDDAKPLTSYYCILNASKALLRFKGISDADLNSHGVSSVRSNSEKTNLKNAYTAIKGAGVLNQLSKYYGNQLDVKHYSIFDLLYNIPCVHRAFCITYSKQELFIPIYNPVFVKKDQSKEAWLMFEIKGRYANSAALKSLPSKYMHDIGVTDRYIIRKKKRFKWDIHTSIEDRKKKLLKYHQNVRRDLYYVLGNYKFWYLKKSVKGNEMLSHTPSSVLIFAVFHWLSELVRYNPKLFNKYMKSKQNWLFHEFINKALDQFVDEISCEITGKDIMNTGYKPG